MFHYKITSTPIKLKASIFQACIHVHMYWGCINKFFPWFCLFVCLLTANLPGYAISRFLFDKGYEDLHLTCLFYTYLDKYPTRKEPWYQTCITVIDLKQFKHQTAVLLLTLFHKRCQSRNSHIYLGNPNTELNQITIHRMATR